MFGSKESALMPARALSSGYAIASLDYRLSGDAVFPAAVQDCKAAVRWLRAYGSRYGPLDTDRIVAWGESAGAHIASMLGVTCASPKGDDFEVGDHLEQSSTVSGIVTYYGPSDFLQMDEHVPQGRKMLLHDDPESPESKYIGGPIQELPDQVARANPITYISAEEKAPPFFLAHGTEVRRGNSGRCFVGDWASADLKQDCIVPYHQSVLLYEALKEASVPVTLHPVEGADHVFIRATREQIAALDAATDEFVHSILS